MSSLITASLAVDGDALDFDDCTRVVGIPPTDTFVRRFEYDSSVLAARQWCVESERAELESVDDAVAALFAVFGDRLGAVRDYAAGPGRGVSVSSTVIIHEDRPVYELSAATVRVLADLGAEFLLDIYDFSED